MEAIAFTPDEATVDDGIDFKAEEPSIPKIDFTPDLKQDPAALIQFTPDTTEAISAEARRNTAKQESISSAPGPGILARIRAGLSGMLGPTEEQKQGMLPGQVPNGLIPALSKPIAAIPRFDYSATDRPEEAVFKALMNQAAGFGEFAESPLGMLTAGSGGLAKMYPEAAKLVRLGQRVVSGGFAADMASKVPEAARNAGEQSVNGTTGQALEADIGLAVNTILPGTLGGHAFARERPAIVNRVPVEPPVKAADGQLSEFGGESARDAQVQSPESKVQSQETAAPAIDFVPETPIIVAPRMEFIEGSEPKSPEIPVSSTTNAGEPNAIETRDQPGGAGLQYQGVPQGTDVSANVPEIRPGQSEQASGGGGLRAASADVEASVPVPEPESTTLINPNQVPVVEMPVKDVVIDNEAVPNFKRAAAESESGTVPGQELAGKYERLGTAPIVVWRTKDGKNVVITGRHRLDLARRTGEQTIPAQVVSEQAGFTREMALIFDAEANIRDGQGTVEDYAHYFRNRPTLGRAEAEARGLLSRAKGNSGWDLGKNASDDLYALWQAGKVTEPQALAITRGAPGNAAAQQLGSQLALEGAKPDILQKMVSGFMAQSGGRTDQLDLLGSDDAAIRQMEDMAKRAAAKEREIKEQLAAITGASKRPEIAARLGVNVQDPASVVAKVVELKSALARWQQDWVGELSRTEKPAAFELAKPESIEEQKARLAQVEADALRKSQAEQVAQGAAAPLSGSTGDIGQGDLLGGGDLFSAPAPKTLEQKIDSLKIDTNGKLFEGTLGIPVMVWNGGLDAVKLAVRAGKSLAAAIEDGIAWIKANHPDITFDPDQYRKAMMETYGLREFGQKILADPDVSQQTKQQVTQYVYERRAGEPDLQAAQRIIDEVGFDAAQKVYEGGAAQLPGAIRSKLGDLLLRQLGDQEVKARAAGDTAAVDVLVDRQAKLMDSVLVHKTDVAQELQAMADWSRLSPQAMLATAKELFKSSGDKVMEQIRPALEFVRRGFAEAQADAAQEIKADPTVNGAAREAVDATLANNPTIQELAAKEAAETGKPVDVKGAIRKARKAQNNGNPATSNLDKAIRAALKALNIKLGELVDQHSSTVDAARRTIGERVVTDAGLTGPLADALRKAFDKRFNELAAAKKKAILQQLTGLRVRGTRRVRGAADELVRLSNLGALDDAKYYEFMRKKMKLPVITPELARDIIQRANDVQAQPEGFLRDRKATELLNFIEQQRKPSVMDKITALWYANTLSGPLTHVRNSLDNLNSLGGHTMTAVLRDPGVMKSVVPALVRGAVTGGREAVDVLRTGIARDTRNLKVQAGRTLEQNPFTGPLTFLNNWKFVGRALAAADVLTFKPAEELQWLRLTRDVAKNEGLRGAKLQQRVADLMGNTEQRVDQARVQAKAEGVKPRDFARRVREIIEQQREQAIPGAAEDARQFALRATYNNKPYGKIGDLAAGINHYFEQQGTKSPVMAFVARTVIPFTNIVANVINEKINYTPYGAWRAFRDADNLYSKPTGRLERGDLLTKSIAGTVALSALTATAAQYLHDANPKFAITGNGPVDKEKRRQLMNTGWRPHAIKLGDKYISYQNTPLMVGLTLVGNYLDGIRYGTFKQADAADRLAYGLKQGADVVVQNSFLTGVANLFDALGNDNAKNGAQQVERMMVRAGAGIVSPNALLQLDRLFDPVKYDDTGMKGLLMSQVPFVRRENRPVLNVLGEPVKTGVFDRDFGVQTRDPLWRVLAAQQAWIPPTDKNAIVGDRKRGEDFYRAITPDEYYEIVATSGPRIRARLEPQLQKIELMTPEKAQKYVADIAQEEHAKALKRIGF